MPKSPRIVLPEVPHHVTQRGNDQQAIFVDDSDRLEYISILRERSEWYGLDVLGYCLMSNHIHMAVIPAGQESMASGIGYTHRLYAQRFNRKHERGGHLWEQRFYSCPLDEAHLISALIYIDRNPVRAQMVLTACDYKWSSALAHCRGMDQVGLINVEKWNAIASAYDWSELLLKEESDKELKELRDYTYSGKSFVKNLG